MSVDIRGLEPSKPCAGDFDRALCLASLVPVNKYQTLSLSRLVLYIRTNPAVQQPQPPKNPSPIPVIPPMIDPMKLNRHPVDKIRKHGAEEFKANDDDYDERSEL
ncbi:hypothetical protein F383_16231 [Gossypium arboreum]|uniref:Uncharacterized protein n=1 Tax=Gossypium arboreum TaxID=29729 RepID=A0A0B0NCW3_GOSAR|nr:hypothetical protein F383_16231 [Gossypium arboreum]